MLPYNESFICVQWNSKSWMYDVRSCIGHIPITQVYIIGSHNAATYGIRKKSPFGQDAPGLLHKRAGVAPLARVLARKFSVQWSKCQNMNLIEQLNAGVRYLDLRLTPHTKEEGRLYTTHGQISVPFTEVINSVKEFISNPVSSNEFIVMDFQHLFDMDSNEAQNQFLEEIKVLSDYLIPSEIPLTTPLSCLWELSSKRRIFILAEKAEVEHPGIRIRSDSIISIWVNKRSLRKLLLSLESLIKKDLKNESNNTIPDKLYVTQAILTPDGGSIFSSIFKKPFKKTVSSIKDMAIRVNTNVLEWFCLLNVHSQLGNETVTIPTWMNTHGNILMLDYIELGRCKVLGETRELDAVGMCVYLNMLRASRLKENP